MELAGMEEVTKIGKGTGEGGTRVEIRK
jgi:hypothetical protein